MPQEISLRIVLTQPPAHVAIGLQKGSGQTYETFQTQMSDGQDLTFACPVLVRGDSQTDELPSLSGPFVQGPKNQKFIYLDIGTYAGQHDSIWSRRLKIPLSGISWAFVEQLTTNSVYALETRVPGTGKDGGPNCATVKPFPGWHLTLR